MIPLWYNKFNDGTDMATDAYNTAMDMMNNNGKDLFDWFKPDMGEEHVEFPIWDGNHHGNHHDDQSDHHHDWDSNHHDWFDDGTSWDPSWGPMPTEAPSDWDVPHWGGHHGSRGMDGEIPADLADHDSWLSSLLGDTTDEAMDNTWFPNPWDVMTHTTGHFDIDMGSKMEDFDKPPKGPKGKPGKGGKKPKGPQKGLDARLKNRNI